MLRESVTMSYQEECEHTVRIRNFSDENLHRPGSAAKTEMEGSKWKGLTHFCQAFANGMHAEDEGYVTIDFLDDSGLYRETSCVVSVLDASGNRRFPTSYVFRHDRENKVRQDNIRPFTIDRVVKRDTLLGQPDELLPGDCLTLHIHTFSKAIFLEDDGKESVLSFEFPSNGGPNVLLPLDSVLAKRLTGVSSYFRALSEAPMLERKRGYASFPRREFLPLRSVCDILLGKIIIIIHSVEDLLQIYATADKYDVPPVLDSGRGMLSLVLGAAENDRRMKAEVLEQIPEFLELAGALSDTRSKEMLESFVERNLDEDSGTEDSAADDLETGWRLYHVPEAYLQLTFVRDTHGPEDEFKFYQ